MTQQLNKNTSEVLQWMLDKQDIQVSTRGSVYENCQYKTVLWALSCNATLPTTDFIFRIKPKEIHGVHCTLMGVTLRSGSGLLSHYDLSLSLLLARPEQQKLESMLLEPCMLVTKQFFDEAVANKEMK